MSESNSSPLDVRTALKQGIHLLREARIPSYTLAAELLLLHVTRRDRTWLYAHPEELLDPQILESYFSLIRRRAAGEPTQYLTHKQEFWGLEFEVNPDVLIPRPETEHLIEVALDRLAVRELRHGRDPKLTGETLTIVDIGTGSGCIAIALAKELPAAKIYATDISPAALATAQRNATRLGFHSRITFLESNLLSAFSPTSHQSPITSHQPALNLPNGSPLFDLIISNPPYIGRKETNTLPIEVRDHEPASALYGGEEGYELYGLLIPEAARQLKPSGLLVLELGHDSLPAVRPLLETPQWANIHVTNDLAGIPRVLSAERT
ncbi:MAG TPA: peptide chain release factor N(5)-glutamine methyltransferase [Candidatus Sulfotelmatobacter sp.]|jgi:release factor glutamine methyltransferase|nr:peptide chain release factor N(5)-glutamine methyltransferase [Candidatus Sulfotelmatobacter sp.]